MPERMMLLEILRRSESLTQTIEQQLTGLAWTQSEITSSISRIRNASTFFMMHLVRGFPHQGMPHPRLSLEKARGYLQILHDHLHECAPAREIRIANATLEQACRDVLAQLEQAIAFMAPDPPLVSDRRYIQTANPMPPPQ